jgi:hypothetical protein
MPYEYCQRVALESALPVKFDVTVQYVARYQTTNTPVRHVHNDRIDVSHSHRIQCSTKNIQAPHGSPHTMKHTAIIRSISQPVRPTRCVPQAER